MRPDANSFNDTYRRRRLVARGRHQFIADLPYETVASLGDLKKRGLRNRDQVLEPLIEQGREATQQPTT